MRAQNKRVQNIQSPSVSRLSDSLERRSPDKGLRTAKFVDFEDFRTSRSTERSPVRPGSETPTPADRGSARAKNLENTPPGSSMMALQSMRGRQDTPPLSDITNSASPVPHPTYSFDALSSQILSLTSIVTNVQREMMSLNKRSKDNYSDLMSLKDATTTRDQDIQQSLRTLVSGLEAKLTNLDARLLAAPEASRSTPNLGFYLDEKAHNGSPRPKNFGLPRIGSPSSFSAAFERELTASPSLACVDGAASIALLEKVLREMATREGQEVIMNTLEAVKSQALVRTEKASPSQPAIDPSMMSKLEDILVIMKDMKETSGSKALIRSAPTDHGKSPSNVDMYLDGGAVSKIKPNGEAKGTAMASDVISEEIMKMLKSVKQSLAQGGGLTNEVKVLVRELRGEVLGMGREIARKLDNSASPKKSTAEAQAATRDEISVVVQQGLAELKEHMHHVVQENNQRSLEQLRPTVDAEKVLLAVRDAITDLPRPQETPVRDPVAEREELIAAVRDAWEDCKPEIALEHFGLERDEILETLKEGLKSYQPQEPVTRDSGATYEEVIDAVRKGLADFKTPEAQLAPGVTKEEVMVTVRGCLEEFEWPSLPQIHARENDLTKNDVLDAVRDGLAKHENTTREYVAEAVREGLSHQAPISKDIEFNREDLFDAIKACLEGEQNPLGGMGERVIEAMHEFLSSMKTEFQQYSAASGKDTEQVLDALKDGLEDLRGDIESYVDRNSDVTGKDEIIDTVKAGFAAMQADLDKGFANRTNGAPNTPELLDAMEKEFQHLRDTISKSISRSGEPLDKDEILDAIHDLSDDRQSLLSSNSEDIVRLVKEELEHMRTTLAGTLMKSGGSLDRDEVFEVIREGLESARSAPKDGNESILSNTSELLDAFQDGVDGIRADIQKLTDRPVDLSTSFEILDMLKSGIEDVRADIRHLHEKQNETSDSSSTRGQEMVVHDQNRISTEIEGLKVMITQLRIKVEALDGMGPPPAPSDVRMHKDDLDEIYGAIHQVEESINQSKSEEMRLHKDGLDGIFTAIHQVNDTVNKVRDAPSPEVIMPETAASKEDTDAIETLLRNVKAQLDEVFSPDAEPLAKAAQIDAMEGTLKDLRLAVEDSVERATESNNKEDFTIIELLLKDVQGSVEDFKMKLEGLGSSSNESAVSQTDFQVLQNLCMDIKSRMEDMKLPDLDTLPNKEDLTDVKNDLKAFREQLEADNGLTAQAFEARKIEHGGLATKIDDVKNLVGDLRDELMVKVDGGAEGIVELNKVLGMHHDDMSKYATAASITEMADMIKAELEKHMEHHSASKTEMEERDATLFTKHDETGTVLKDVIDEKFNELMTKYDDAQLASDAKLSALEDRDSAHLEATNKTKVVVDDLKSLMDTLGSTVTDTCERVSADSKTVFESIEETNSKLETLHTSNAFEHGATREEVTKILAIAARLETSTSEHNPAVLAAIREVLGVVSQHYEHSQQQTESFAKATEEIKSGVDSIPAAIPPLLPALTAAPPSPILAPQLPAQKEYDDSEVHDKLDTLLSHATLAKEIFAGIENHQKDAQDSLANLSKLDEIRDQVMGTAAEIAGMVTTQARLMAEHHKSKAAEATEAAIALEKRTAQKEKVEADIVSLNSEKNALIESMAQMRREQDDLINQTKRLTRDVAKLETALNIRQDEMREMNARAEILERRILEGLVNHARSSKPSRPTPRPKVSPAERDASMNLKRVPSSTSTVTRRTSLKGGNSTIGSAVSVALKKRNPLGTNAKAVTTPRTSTVDRRILSTSHVTGNRGRNAADMALVLAPIPKSTGLVSLKRSHSVKSNPSSYLNGRKASWNGAPSDLTDKENYTEEHDDSIDDGESDVSTERRTSYGTSVMYSDSMTYGTGSSLSGHSRRSTSCASSIVGTVNGHTDVIAEEDEDPEEDDPNTAVVLHSGAEQSQVNAGQDNSMGMTTMDDLDIAQVVVDGLSDLQPPPLITEDGLKYHGSDSGLGTEPMTASTDDRRGEAQEYFEMTAQDMQT